MSKPAKKTKTKKPVTGKYRRHPVCRLPDGVDLATTIRLTDAGRWARATPAPAVLFLSPDPDDKDAAILRLAACKCRDFTACPLTRALAAVPDLDMISARVEYLRAARRPTPRA